MNSCPYSSFINKIPFLNSDNKKVDSKEIEKVNHIPNEINPSEKININCNDNNSLEKNYQKGNEIEFSTCPYKDKINQQNKNKDKNDNKDNNNDNLIKINDNESDEDLPKGGCPVMNGSKKFT
jgi:hypothetical protein